jgi:hypothetical protein
VLQALRFSSPSAAVRRSRALADAAPNIAGSTAPPGNPRLAPPPKGCPRQATHFCIRSASARSSASWRPLSRSSSAALSLASFSSCAAAARAARASASASARASRSAATAAALAALAARGSSGSSSCSWRRPRRTGAGGSGATLRPQAQWGGWAEAEAMRPPCWGRGGQIGGAQAAALRGWLRALAGTRTSRCIRAAAAASPDAAPLRALHLLAHVALGYGGQARLGLPAAKQDGRAAALGRSLLRLGLLGLCRKGGVWVCGEGMGAGACPTRPQAT